VVNASIWFGALVFFTVCVGPAFFSHDMVNLLSKPYAGAAAQIVIGRYFHLQMWCAAVALAHLIAEWLYTGRPFQRYILGLLMVLFVIGIFGGYVLAPKMKELHARKYAPGVPATLRQSAERSFSILHGTSMLINLFVISGVLVYLWQVTKPVSSTRFASVNRFKT
jgi:hypothetical protein